MRVLINNLLALLIFISPIVSGLNFSNCSSKENVTIEKVNCHGASEQNSPNFICVDCGGVCADCFLQNYVDKNTILNFPISIKHDSLVFVYIESIPFLDFPPLFRPPIG